MSKVQASDGSAVTAGSADGAEIARRIRSARARAGFTRKQLANASGASERYLALMEAGKGNPTIAMLINVADALGLAVAELLPVSGERDQLVEEAAQLLRRLPPDHLTTAVAALRKPLSVEAGKARRIALVGLRGAGKSTLGQRLASRLDVPFFEISKEIVRRYGGSPGVLLEVNGPAAVRRYEAEILDDICKHHQAAVIAAPGAVVSDGKLYERLLRDTWAIWLQATPEDHMERVVKQGDLRPMSGNRSAMADLRAILKAREPDYARADRTIDTSQQNLSETVHRLELVVRQLIDAI